MLPVLFLVTLIMSLLLLALRRDMRGFLLSLTVIMISFFFYTIDVYIAKKGGISDMTVLFLYGTTRVKQKLLYSVYTVRKLGFMMAVGRYLSPFFILLTALNMAGRLYDKKAIKLVLPLSILPISSIVVYHPSVFTLLEKNAALMKAVVTFSRLWIYIYIATSAVIMLSELYRTKLSFFKARFSMKVLLVFSLSLSYGLFSPQDPAQVYLFYTNEYMWMMGLWYLHKGFSSGFYYVILLGSLLAGLVSIFSLIRYFAITFGEEVVEVKMNKQSLHATRGVSVFVHGTKNALISSRILLEKVERRYQEDEDVERLIRINRGLTERLEKMNKTIKVNSIRLYPTQIGKVIDEALSRVRETFGSYPVNVEEYETTRLILADDMYLAEALYNIMQNGIEALDGNGRKDALEIKVRYGRLWVEISITDRGKGIDKKMAKHIWEPFMSSKNSSKNWGIGMYFTRLVINRHMGRISFSPNKDGGTKFVVILPLLDRREEQDIDNITRPLWKYFK